MERIDKEEYFLDFQPREGAWLRRVAVEHWHPPTLLKRRGVVRTMLIMVDRGELEIRTDLEESWKVGVGEIAYIANGSAQDLGVDPVEGCGMRLLIFDEVEGEPLCLEALGEKSRMLSLQDLKETNRLVDNILDALRAPWPGHEVAVHHLAQAFIMTLLGRRGDAREDRRPYLEAREIILREWRDLESVRELPALVGTSQPTLGKLFKKHEICTPHQFLLKQKMNYALYALQLEGKSVSELAYELGFADPFTFSRSFKAVVGSNPSKFK